METTLLAVAITGSVALLLGTVAGYLYKAWRDKAYITRLEDMREDAYDEMKQQEWCCERVAELEARIKELEDDDDWDESDAFDIDETNGEPPMTEPRLNSVPLYTNEKIDDIVDNHIFLDNGTSTYRVFEDRANKYLREMRDAYERQIAFWQRYGVVKNLELLEAQHGQAAREAAGE